MTGEDQEVTDVAVVGAGLSGLVCARELLSAGHSVQVFDKSGDISGRLATRRRESLRWNHGAPFVQARSDAFTAFMKDQQKAGFAHPVRLPRGELGFRGLPDMREMLRGVAAGLNASMRFEVAALRRNASGWYLQRAADSQEAGPFRNVVLAMPGPQARSLLEAGEDIGAAPICEQLASVRMACNWSMLLEFDEEVPMLDRLPLDYVVESITREVDGLAYVVRFGAQWSSERIDIDRKDIVPVLKHTLASRLGSGEKLPKPVSIAAHRWRFAETSQPLGEYCLWHPELGIGVCGDWCLGAYAEHAYLSGTAMAQALSGQATGR